MNVQSIRTYTSTRVGYVLRRKGFDWVVPTYVRYGTTVLPLATRVVTEKGGQACARLESGRSVGPRTNNPEKNKKKRTFLIHSHVFR